MDEYKISIIMPAYNVENYIEKCINSILESTYKNFELLIINDCSSDNTEEKIISFTDKRIKYFKNSKNLKASLSRNIGIENATGDFILFSDADDYISEDWIKNLVTAQIKTESDVVIGNSIAFDKKNYEKLYLKDFQTEGTHKYTDLKISANAALWNKLYSAKIVKDTLFVDGIHTGQDRLFNYMALGKANKISYTKKGYYYYRKDNPNSITNTKKIIDIFESYKKILEEVEAFNKSRNKKDINTYMPKKVANIMLYNYFILNKETRSKYKLFFERKWDFFLPEKIKFKIFRRKITGRI